jgi:hypothetical protein
MPASSGHGFSGPWDELTQVRTPAAFVAIGLGVGGATVAAGSVGAADGTEALDGPEVGAAPPEQPASNSSAAKRDASLGIRRTS